MIICPNSGDECTKKIAPQPKSGFLIISSEENNSKIKKRLEDIFLVNDLKLRDAINIRGTGNIHCKICEQILSSAFGVILITKNTPEKAWKNMFYEFGLMAAFGKEVIVLTDNKKNIPSDLQGKEFFTFKSYKQLANKIKDWKGNFKTLTDYWYNLGNLSMDGEDYEKAYEYYRRAIMFGDFENSPLELNDILKKSSKKEITISNRLKENIKQLITFIDS